MEELHQRLLKHFDVKCAALRAIHADITFANPSALAFKRAAGRFAEAQAALWQCKGLWAQLEQSEE